MKTKNCPDCGGAYWFWYEMPNGDRHLDNEPGSTLTSCPTCERDQVPQDARMTNLSITATRRYTLNKEYATIKHDMIRVIFPNNAQLLIDSDEYEQEELKGRVHMYPPVPDNQPPYIKRKWIWTRRLCEFSPEVQFHIRSAFTLSFHGNPFDMRYLLTTYNFTPNEDAILSLIDHLSEEGFEMPKVTV